MAYIGVSPSNGVRRVYDYTATAGQTSFSGSDNNSQTLSYRDSAYIDVYQNGVLLIPSDYTATTGTSVVLDTGATVNDSVQIVVYDVFSVADTVSKADGGTFESNISIGGTLGVTGNTTFTGDIGVGDDVNLTSDSSQITFGADSEVILAHTHNEGLKLQGSGLNTNFSLLSFDTTDGTVPDLRLGKSSSATVGTFAETANGESLGQIRFTGQDSNNGVRSGGAIAVDQTGSSTSSTVPSAMKFSTTGSERMRIVDEGLLINCTSTLHSGVERSLEVENHSGSGFVAIFKGNTASHETVAIHNSATSGTRILLAFKTSGSTGTLVGRVTSDGSTTNYATSSDYRLKENVEDMTGAIDRVKQLSPKRFNFINDDTNTLVDGFLAHEAQSVVAEAVTGTHNEVDDDGNAVMQGIDQAKLVPLLTGALKEAIAKIEALEARITALENAE